MAMIDCKQNQVSRQIRHINNTIDDIQIVLTTPNVPVIFDEILCYCIICDFSSPSWASKVLGRLVFFTRT